MKSGHLSLGDKAVDIGIILLAFPIGVASFIGSVTEVDIWFGAQVSASVVEWKRDGSDEFVVIEYFNPKKGLYYTVEKEVHQRSAPVLREKKQVLIKYSRLFPSVIRIVGMRQFDLIGYLIGIFFGFGVAYRGVLALLGKISQSEFTG